MSSRSLTLEQARAPRRRLVPLAWLAVGVARSLTLLPPRRLRRVLNSVRRGARPAGEVEAARARDTVVAVSVQCAGPRCLQRALATALLCRLTGCWPELLVGVRSRPFQAHSWIAVDGRAVGENPNTIGGFHVLMSVPPPDRQEVRA